MIRLRTDGEVDLEKYLRIRNVIVSNVKGQFDNYNRRDIVMFSLRSSTYYPTRRLSRHNRIMNTKFFK